IVFQHANGQSDRWPAPLTDDYSSLVDPRIRSRQTDWNATAGLIGRPGPTTPSNLDVEDQGVSWPPRYVNLEDQSPVIRQALQRLEESSRYRVLTKLSWIQPLDRDVRTRAVRVRGDELLSLDRTSTPSLIRTIRTHAPSDGFSLQPQYRLDGSLTLRQQQFRHVDLDLVWREPAPTSQVPGIFAPSSEASPELLIHRLKLSRPIGLDRLEYFDSAWLGVLVYVQEWIRPEIATSPSQVTSGP
ncbi:MAG TPA: CsiV family protein, partial [Wenzhouxiangella sp.]|nr:CsiV family protein [Wenzhouxiangella sp.]